MDTLTADTLTLYIDSLEYPRNEEAMQKRWQQWIKYQFLRKLAQPVDQVNSLSDTLIDKPMYVKQWVLERENCRVQKILDHPMGLEDYVTSKYLGTLAELSDPHTNYFSFSDLLSYVKSTSAEAGSESYGIEFGEKFNGDIQVVDVVPGGPAWKSNELHEGDILVQIATDTGEQISLGCNSLDQLEELLATKEDELSFTFQNQAGQLKTLTLAKERLSADENAVKSLILEGERKIGYISLPSFYTNWEDDAVDGCSADLARALIKLKREQIEGLILDLRFNGGGSVLEAMDLAGIFIEQGPLALAKQQDGDIRLLKDRNRGTIYDGPMAVMVNGLSASASEMVAAALQDYNRAIIVGSPTFGKSTAQVVRTLDGEPLNDYSGLSSFLMGFIKVTIEKLYRLTGRSHQLRGVFPDVSLPDVLEYASPREADYPTALAWDQVEKKVYYKPLEPLPIGEISERSLARIESSASFQEIKTQSLSLYKISQNAQQVVLVPAYFKQAMARYKHLTVGTSLADKFVFKASFDHFDGQHPISNLEQGLLYNIQSDLYINETFQIVSDLIELNNE